MEGQAAQRARLAATNADNRAHAEGLRALLTPGMLLWAPLDGGWTIGQVFEHLVVTHESYHERLRALLARARAAAPAAAAAATSAAAPAASSGAMAAPAPTTTAIAAAEGAAAPITPTDGALPDFAWKPSLLGGWLARGMAAPGKMPAPGRYRPAAQPRADVVGAYLKALDRTGALLADSAGLEWQRLRLSSPISPLIRMNAGDAFTILAHHDTRHLKQVERVRGQAGFPRPR